MRPSTLWRLYRARVRAQPGPELLAVLGVAAGVALVFAVLVANASLAGSVDQLHRAIIGNATVEVAARSDHGIPARTAAQVAVVDGVAAAAPVLERRVTLAGPSGDRAVLLIGATYALRRLDGPVTQALGADGLPLNDGVYLTRAAADAIGVEAGRRLTVKTGGRERPARTALALDAGMVGGLSEASVAVTSLDHAQRLASRPGRVTRVIVKTAPGAEERVRERLAELFGRSANVRAADTESELIRQAAGPNDQSTGLFAAAAAGVGLLFTLNALLLTVPARRRLLHGMQVQGGFSTPQLATLLAFEALVLGAAGTALGLVVGDQLSRHVFASVPGYLTFAFPVGAQRVITASDVAAAVAAGLLGSVLAAAQPLVAIVRTPRPRPPRRPAAARAALTGAALLGVTAATALAAPSLTLLAIGTLVAGMLLMLPAVLHATAVALGAVAARSRRGALTVAAGELRAGPVRAAALAATVAVAVCATTAIEGAHRDLLRGLDRAAYGLTHTADVWAQPAGVENTLTTMSYDITAHDVQRLRATPGIDAVRAYQGGFLDVGGRRMWVIGRPADDLPTIPAGQVIDGDARRAAQRIRDGGWAAVSKAAADERGMRLGEPFTLPTPAGPARLRLAATLSNVGWAPGTVIMSQPDYARWWLTTDPSALEVDLAPGIPPDAGAAIVRDALDRQQRSGLAVQTAHERWGDLRRNARQGLSRLTEISTLLIIGAILATAAAMTASVWQRRARLAEMRAQGFSPGQVWAMLLAEAAALLAAGCALGAAAGLVGQRLLAHWLVITTGFPAASAPALALAAAVSAIVALAALVVIAIPGRAAARAPLSLSLRHE